ncbi:uncharacterized protein [Haliotis cracherodii]|uniref:uncharacterized protein n=1 Tax=Haliotis cracherodii TaxID=6455 RepID=UPI0039EBB6D6
MASVYALLGDREIEVMTVNELKACLGDHGQFVTGKKSELVERAKGVSKLYYPTISSATMQANLPTRLHENTVSDVCSHAIVRCKVIPSLPASNKKECLDHTIWISRLRVELKCWLVKVLYRHFYVIKHETLFTSPS